MKRASIAKIILKKQVTRMKYELDRYDSIISEHVIRRHAIQSQIDALDSEIAKLGTARFKASEQRMRR